LPRLFLPGRALWPQHLEQIADLSIVDERVSQGKLRSDLVAIAPTVPLSQYIAVFDQVIEDLVCAPLGDADRSGDVAKTNSGIIGDTKQDMSVIGEEVPATCSRIG
jgi:hypothetical protein